jgi:hypothetical protein
MNTSILSALRMGRRRWVLLSALSAVVAAVSWAATESPSQSPEDQCRNAMRQFARHVNAGEFAAAYKMLAPPMYDVMTESDFRDFMTLHVTEQPLEEKETVAEFGRLQTELILTVQEPQIDGRDAIAGMIVAADPRILGSRFISDPGDVRKLRDPAWIQAVGLPTWGAQLKTLGLNVKDCDLVSDLEVLIGAPDSSSWPIAKEWLVASLDKEGEWRIWPHMHHARSLDFRMKLSTREIWYNVATSAGSGSIPWVLPKPSLENLRYARWVAVERDPAKCPKCGRYVQQDWRYCPYDGTKLEHGGSPAGSPGAAGAGRAGGDSGQEHE